MASQSHKTWWHLVMTMTLLCFTHDCAYACLHSCKTPEPCPACADCACNSVPIHRPPLANAPDCQPTVLERECMCDTSVPIVPPRPPIAANAPVLRRQPTVLEVGEFQINVGWYNAFDGDGPVVGYTINLRSDDDASWTTVGFVSARSPREFTVTRLDPDTPYVVMVAIVTDDPDRSEKPGPATNTRTLPLYLTAPVLLLQPTILEVGKFQLKVGWNDAFSGDGPVVGYTINLKTDDDARWSTVGFVSARSLHREFTVTRLNPDTPYVVMVAIVTDDPDRSGRTGPSTNTGTLPLVSPSLSNPPSQLVTGTTYFALSWAGDYNGDGPIAGYNIKTRPKTVPDDVWSSAGFVPMSRNTRGLLQYNVTGLQPDTSYEALVDMVDCHRFPAAQDGPVITANTSSLEIPTLRYAPVFSDIGTTYFVVQWDDEIDGHGPITGYAVKVRAIGESDWVYVGLVPHSQSPMMHKNVTGLKPDTSYEVTVGVLRQHSGGGESGGPVKRVKTLGEVSPTEPTQYCVTSPSIDQPGSEKHQGQQQSDISYCFGEIWWIIVPPYVCCAILVLVGIHCYRSKKLRNDALDADVDVDDARNQVVDQAAEKDSMNDPSLRALVAPCGDHDDLQSVR